MAIKTPNVFIIALDTADDPIILNMNQVAFVECKSPGTTIDFVYGPSQTRTVKISEADFIDFITDAADRFPVNRFIFDLRP